MFDQRQDLRVQISHNLISINLGHLKQDTVTVKPRIQLGEITNITGSTRIRHWIIQTRSSERTWALTSWHWLYTDVYSISQMRKQRKYKHLVAGSKAGFLNLASWLPPQHSLQKLSPCIGSFSHHPGQTFNLLLTHSWPDPGRPRPILHSLLRAQRMPTTGQATRKGMEGEVKTLPPDLEDISSWWERWWKSNSGGENGGRQLSNVVLQTAQGAGFCMWPDRGHAQQNGGLSSPGPTSGTCAHPAGSHLSAAAWPQGLTLNFHVSFARTTSQFPSARNNIYFFVNPRIGLYIYPH